MGRRWRAIALGTASAGLGALGVPADAGAEERAGRDDSIIVIGSAQPIAIDKLGRAVTVITRQELEAQGVAFVGDALRQVPGLAVTRQGAFGGLTQVRIRGGEANHVLVLIDGVEASSADTGEIDFARLLAQDIERIEILRGPQSGLYGSNALAGVINIITRRGGGERRVELEASGGAFETYETSLYGSLGDDDNYLSGSAFYRVSEGFNASPTGDEPDGDESTNVYLRAGRAFSDVFKLDATARFSASQTDTDDFDFSGGPDQGTSVDAPGFSDTLDWDVGTTATLSLHEERWVTRLFGSYTDTELLSGGDFGVFGSETSRTKLALQSSLAFDTPAFADAAHMVTGFVEREDESFRNTEPVDPSQIPEQRRELSAYGAEYRLELFDRLFLTGAARKDHNDDFADTDSYSVSAAYVLASLGLRLHASAGDGVTNPTFFEQFGFTPDTFVGNPLLLPENAASWDAGVEKRWGGGDVTLDVTYFESRLNDEIDELFPTVVNESGESTRWGLETTFSAQLGADWSVFASHTFTEADDPDGSPEIRRPEHTASLDVSGALWRDRATVNLGVVYTGESYDDDFRGGFTPVKTKTDAYTLVRVSGDVYITDRVEVFARVENLLDEEYEDVIGFANPGRAAYAGVRITLAGSD